MRRGSSMNSRGVGSSGKSHNNINARGHPVELPPVETVVARLETLTKLLHETNQTRLGQVFMEIQVLADDLRQVGPYMEQAYPDALDRVMASMRDASASSSLPPALRLAVFELVELRAAKWILPSDTCNYYRQRRILKDSGDDSESDLVDSADLPSDYTGSEAPKAFRQEVLIKNSDSGKVMGVRGRRISKIEKLSDTIVSFEKVDPSAKERVLSINGYSQQSINLAKQLIQETITRNASPIFDGPPSPSASTSIMENTLIGPPPLLPTPLSLNGVVPNGVLDDGHGCHASVFDQLLSLDNFLNQANNDAMTSSGPGSIPVPLFNYTVTVGTELLRVSGNNLSLVQEAKLALDDYFTQKYPQMYYTMHVRTRTTSNENDITPTFHYDGDIVKNEDVTSNHHRVYNRAQLLSLAEKIVTPPDFSHLDTSIKNSIILKKPKRFDENNKKFFSVDRTSS